MKTTKFLGLPVVLLIFMLISVPFQSCNPDDNCDDDIIDYKPNIYIYPTTQLNLNVQISFPMGGEIITSIPDYGKGWNITVDTNGLIDNKYRFLFYESKQPNVWQREQGWIIKKDNLESFFRANMAEYGFKGMEIEDFIEYWIPLLDKNEFYLIYPQTKNILYKVISLDVSIQPDNMLRLHYLIKGTNNNNINLTAPTIEGFKRDGYYITEWGVIL
jgi:hypothetical protein